MLRFQRAKPLRHNTLHLRETRKTCKVIRRGSSSSGFRAGLADDTSMNLAEPRHIFDPFGDFDHFSIILFGCFRVGMS